MSGMFDDDGGHLARWDTCFSLSRSAFGVFNGASRSKGPACLAFRPWGCFVFTFAQHGSRALLYYFRFSWEDCIFVLGAYRLVARPDCAPQSRLA